VVIDEPLIMDHIEEVNVETADYELDAIYVNGDRGYYGRRYASIDAIDMDYSDIYAIYIRDFVGNDLSCFEVFTEIQSLTIYDSHIADFQSICKFPKLESLDIDSTDIGDLHFLNNLYTLNDLSLSNCGLEDISELSSLIDLETLGLNGNNISDITPLQNLVNLRKLCLSANDISDLSVIANMSFLEELILIVRNYGITSIKPLEKLEHLKWVQVSAAVFENIPDSELEKYGGRGDWGSNDYVIEVD